MQSFSTDLIILGCSQSWQQWRSLLVSFYHITERELALNRKFYFSYGANTNIDAMAHRCPKARRVGKAILCHYKLVFRGVADVQGSKNSIVCGALWSITPECENALDDYEGFPFLYDKKFVSVLHNQSNAVETMLYVMTKPSSIEPPAKQYVKLIAQGYSDFGIPMQQLTAAVEEAEQACNEEIEQILRVELGYSIEHL